MLEGYEIEGELGVGGMGTVYRARVVGTEQRVAVKVLHDDLASVESARKRFRREVHAMCRVKSSYFVRVLDILMEKEPPFFVMELLDGEDLATRLARGPIPLEEALYQSLEIARAMCELHALGIVHRDLKPANVFLVAGDRTSPIKVLDFGIARVPDESLSVSTMSGAIGTISHMAPEQILKPEDACKASDVFSYGVILFEMLAGAHPFRRRDIVLPMAILREAPLPMTTFNPSVPQPIVALIEAALEKEPNARPTMPELTARLSQELGELDDDFDLAETQEVPSASNAADASGRKIKAHLLAQDEPSITIVDAGLLAKKRAR